MKAAYFTRQGAAKQVMKSGSLPELLPADDEVQIAIHYSGVNPGETKKRADSFGVGMPYDKIIPHSDGAGYVSKVGKNIEANWLGKKVLCFGAQSYRPYGTAAEFCCVPLNQVVELTDGIDLKQAAQMGIPGITAYHAVNPGDAQEIHRSGQLVLVQGGSGAVGQCAIALAVRAGATVLATVRKEADIKTALQAGAEKVYLANKSLAEKLINDYRQGVNHIVEVAFAANIDANVAVLKLGGSIATYATNQNPASIPFWELVFKNISVYFLGSDDFTAHSKLNAAKALVSLLDTGWKGLEIGAIYPLDQTAEAHLHVEEHRPGRALVQVN